MGMQQGWSGGRKSKGKTWAGTFTVVPVGKSRRGRGNILGLASLSHFGRQKAVGMVSSV